MFKKSGSYKVNQEQPPENHGAANVKRVSTHTEALEEIKSTIIEKNSDGSVQGENVERRRDGLRGEVVTITEEVVTHSKTEKENQLIKDAITSNEFLSNILQQAEIEKIVSAMSPLEIERQKTIIRQGEDGDMMYVSDSGTFEIVIDGKTHAKFSDNRVFGELAILYNNPRFATIEAVTKCRVWVLSRNVYKQIIRRTAMAEELERTEFLKSTPVLNKANDRKLNVIATLFHNEFFKSDAVIVQQGDVGDKFFIIKSGSAAVRIEGKGQVAVLKRGEHFGERALLEEDCRQATVVAGEPGVECLTLSRLDFNNYLGDLPTFLEKEDDEERKASVEVTEYVDAKFKEFKVLQVIGVGGFGRVVLVKFGEALHAMKSLKKHNIVRNGQREQAYNERGIQIKCKNPFIVNLYRTFQDKKYLYFLLEYCMGGDLFGLMLRQPNRCFDEKGAKFIAACVLEALGYLHTRSIAYLDLKPENVMINAQGYAKLTDFGNAVYLPNNARTFIFAGTAEYVAPEIIYERGHDKSADYWAFGVFIFELLVGKTPFKTNDPTYMKTYNLILKGIDDVSFPGRVPKPAKLLVKELCKGNFIRRLGCQKNGVEDVRRHKWFDQFEWSKLQQCKLESPFVPELTSPNDTKYFDKFRADSDVPPDYETWEGF